jgi:hypothetical protein
MVSLSFLCLLIALSTLSMPVSSFASPLSLSLSLCFLYAFSFLSLSVCLMPFLSTGSWECGTLMYEMIAGEFPYRRYPQPGPKVENYAPVDEEALARVNPVLVR